jgi:hypothetical protein
MNAWTEKAKTSFWSKVDQSGGPAACWPWTLSRTGTGYGQVNMGKSHGPSLRAHRVAFQLANGEIPAGGKDGKHGVVVLHTCDNRLCCNPKHLRTGTQADNVRDAFAKGRVKTPQANDAEVKRRSAAYQKLVEALRLCGERFAVIQKDVAPFERNVDYIKKIASEFADEARALLRALGEDA